MPAPLAPRRLQLIPFFLAMLLALAINVRVTTVDGTSIDASLVGIVETGYEIDVDQKTRVIPFQDALSIIRADASPGFPPGMQAQLIGGSRIAITGVTMDETDVKFMIRDQSPIAIPVKQVRWIRLRQSSATLDPQWLGTIEKPNVADILVVRRSADSLDEVEGIAKSITEKNVVVDLDGETLSAPIEKLEGIVFANVMSDADEGKLLVEDINGSKWRAKAILPGDNGEVRIELYGGISVSFPISQVKKIEATDAVQFLASETPAEGSYQAVSKIGLDATVATQWFGAQSVDDRDIIMHADSDIQYRLDDRYTTLQGSVSVDPEVVAGGRCELKIWMDDNVAWQQSFDVDALDTKGFELPIGSAKRVRFELKSGDDGDMGDTVRIRQPRLIK